MISSKKTLMLQGSGRRKSKTLAEGLAENLFEDIKAKTVSKQTSMSKKQESPKQMKPKRGPP